MARVATAEGRGESPEAGDRSARSRQAILAVAAGTIARHGIHGLRVERVAKEAGVSTALLYYHFGSRSGLVNAAFEYASELAPSTALRLASDEQSGYEAVAAALLAELDESPDVREFSVVWGDVSANAVFEPELRPSVRTITRAWRLTVAAAIERGVADGSIRSDVDPDEAAELLIVLVDGFCIRWLSGSLELERARHLLSKVLAQLRPPDEAGAPPG
ncbi:MAG: TetR/AcrR family transcriptional regulator [Thermoleophilia bacterium]|nr:TetR/AcrR family transcriptional regulator [Thermoleophilia bacterium]